MSITLYIPCDSSAISLGADRIAVAIAKEAEKRGITIELIRNGSRGLFWLEPLVEVVTEEGRLAYGPVKVSDVAGLFDANFIQGGAHPLSLGLTEELDYLKKQQRLTFARIGKTDPVSLDDYINNDGYRGLGNALNMSQAAIVKTVTDSGLRGRGGAAFPT
ncbi:MAG TPA: formate dehydrogenase, partial [Methylococcales bacterium]